MSVITRTDVTAVKLYKTYVMAGIGSWIHVFDRNSVKLVQKIHALNGQKIYNFIASTNNEILVFGGKQFTVISRDEDGIFVKIFEAILCDDWLHSGIWVTKESVALLTAHNVVLTWDIRIQCKLTEHINKENCILYSGLLVPINDDILVFSGTVFSEVLIQRCGSDVVLHSLKGHKGVIFSISCDPYKGVIVTTSDDRSVRIWQLENTSSFPHSSIDFWENVNITCKHELYGHLARVMRNCITDDFVVSIGEDSCVCFWGYDGTMLRTLTIHKNACVWSLDVDNKHLVTGGGDSAVILHPLSVVKEYGSNEVLNIEITNAKKVVFTARRNIVIMTECGDLVYYNTTNKSSTAQKLKHKSTFKLLSISSCRQLIATVDMVGKLDVFIETCKGPPSMQNLVDTQLEIGKILSMKWAGNRHLVFCSDVGVITVLASKATTTEVLANFILPPCKERWLTSAAINLSKDMLVVSDRCGTFHVYVIGQKNPIQSLKNVHGRYGATSINIQNNEIVTTGRDGNVKYFHVDDDYKLKYMWNKSYDFQWVETFVDKDKHYICGFQERVFVMYDIRNSNKLFEVACGGGRRSWDVVRYIEKVEDTYEEYIKFVYLKNYNIIAETFKVSKVRPTNVIMGTHSKEINCLKTYVSMLDSSITLMFSGGEDTSLRISRLCSNNDFRDEIIFKQLSNVRTVKYMLLENDKMLLVSAGGRAQICIKLIKFEKFGDEVKIVSEELCDYLINGTDKERKGNQTWRNCSIEFDPETRIMDVDIIKCDGNNYLIAAGCSDAYLRIFCLKYDKKHIQFKLQQELKYHDTCILKTQTLHYYNKTLLITCTTRGIATLWHITNVNDLENLEFKPFISFTIHKSGINSLSNKVVSDREILIATGGDDNAIHLNLIELDENLEANVRHKWSSSSLHCAEITGIAIIDDLVITTSIDQRVTLLRWQIDEGIKCDFLTQVYSDVADIQGLEVLKNDSESVTVCVFGKGFEVIAISTTLN